MRLYLRQPFSARSTQSGDGEWLVSGMCGAVVCGGCWMAWSVRRLGDTTLSTCRWKKMSAPAVNDEVTAP
jgi:hypothetical protein